MDIISIVIPILALVAGWLMGFLVTRGPLREARERKAELEKELQNLRERNAGLEAENRRIGGLDTKCATLTDDLLQIREKLGEFNKLESEVKDLRQLRDGTQKTIDRLNRENAELLEQKKAMDVWYENAKSEFTGMFATLSQSALKENRGSFLDLARESLGKFQETAKGDLDSRQNAIRELIKPVKESLEKFDTRVQDLEIKREGAYSGLNEQFRSMAESQAQLRIETSNLVRALRAPQTRGRWGEIQLRRVAEMAGMLNYCHFQEQVLEKSDYEDESDKKPDMIIRLPGGKNVIVDAKTVFAAFSEAINEADDTIRLAKLKQHAQQVRSRIKALSSKSYWTQFQPTPEFVVLFLPGESLLYAALEQDPKLIEDGMSDYVILATPTTLIAMLKAIYYGWRQEGIAENAREISEMGSELYKSLATAVEHFDKLGTHLNQAVTFYNKSVGSLERNVLSKARNLKGKGISAGDKELSELQQIESNARFVEKEELRQHDLPLAAGTNGKDIEQIYRD